MLKYILLFVVSLYVLIRIMHNLIRNNEKLFYSTKDYPEFQLLENNWELIRDEIPEFDINKPMIKRSREIWNDNRMDDFFELLKKNNAIWIKSWDKEGAWYSFPLIYNNKPYDKAKELCPNTINILKKFNNIRIAGYSLLVPYGKLEEHTDETGPTYNSMAYLMPLVGKNCSLSIKGQKIPLYRTHKHKMGKAVIFNSELKHMATNYDNMNRIILYIDFSTK